MLVTELYKGQGLGNQLACYIATRVFATDKGYDFGIQYPENFKGLDFLSLDFGKTVIGGKGPQGGPPLELPVGITHYYAERKIIHPNGSDIRTYDPQLVFVQDNTKIDGLMQDEQYILHHKDAIREWLKVNPEYDCYEYADENTCVINFRGGEYARHAEFFLRKKYWHDAVMHMRKINKNFRFIVITDDTYTAKKFFPDFDVFHFTIGKDYSIIKNAHYLILSNSSFAWFPAWLSTNVKYCIAPKYWARHNISDGYWSLGYNITSGWHYLDSDGVLSDYDTCLQELQQYMQDHKELYDPGHVNEPAIAQKHTLRSLAREHAPAWLKNSVKSILNEYKNTVSFVRKPLDSYGEKKRQKTWLSQIQIAEYRKTIKVYDVFNFFNELEVLDIRLHVLNDHVDYFVLVESTLTHSGLPKELYYEKNKHLFKEFEHKIIHYVIDTPLKDFEDAEQRLLNPVLPALERNILEMALSSDGIGPGETSFLRDYYEKESVKKALLNLNDNDFCFVSDLDEIWNPDEVIDYSKDDLYKFRQTPYMYFLNNRSNEDWTGWTGTIATKYKNIKNACLNDLRTFRKSKNKYTIIRNGGWHFTFQGGAQRIKTKIESYSHQEINNSETKDSIFDTVSKNKDVRGKGIRFWIDENDLPPYILENKEKFKELLR